MFKEALHITLGFEGGYSNHERDNGGKTYKGITETRWYEVARKWGVPTRFEDITDEDVERFYLVGYWNTIAADSLPAPLAVVAFDVCVNHGEGIALKWLSETRDPVRMTQLRYELWTNHEDWDVFGKGWARRGMSVLNAALAFTDRVETLVIHQPGQGAYVLPGASVLRRGTKLDIRLDSPRLAVADGAEQGAT